MEITKKKWNRYLQAENDYQLDIRLQIEKEPYVRIERSRLSFSYFISSFYFPF